MALHVLALTAVLGLIVMMHRARRRDLVWSLPPEDQPPRPDLRATPRRRRLDRYVTRGLAELDVFLAASTHDGAEGGADRDV